MGPAIDDLDDDPTCRFAVQACPACRDLTTVDLGAATAPCEACGEVIEVAPLPRAE